MDYLSRDSYHLGLPLISFDDIIKNVIIDSDQHIAFDIKTYYQIEALFELRYTMFKNVYRHPEVLKFDKTYFCILRQLGSKIYKYGDYLDDHAISTLMLEDPELTNISYLILNTSYCSNYIPSRSIKTSGHINQVRFIDPIFNIA
jgi:HD superfamily phosphohydrolase